VDTWTCKTTYPRWQDPPAPINYTVYEGDSPNESTFGKISDDGPKPRPLVSHQFSINRLRLEWSACKDSFDNGLTGPTTAEHYDISGNPAAYTGARADSFTFGPTLSAKNKVLSKLEGLNTNLATFLGEGHATYQMLGTTALRLAQAARNIRKGDFSGAGHALGFEPSQRGMSRIRQAAKTARNQSELLGNTWLEYQYGWKPLLSDLYGSVEAFRQGVVPPGRIYHLTAQVSNETTQTFPPINASFNDKLKSRKENRKLKRSSKAKAGVYVQVTSPMAATLQQLGLLNPLSLAWELLPYSFVVDWFLPIGSYLGALSSSLGYTQVRSWSSSELKNELTVDIYNGQLTSVLVMYSRSADYVSPTVKPLLRVLDGVSDSVQRSASAVALLQQAFLRK